MRFVPEITTVVPTADPQGVADKVSAAYPFVEYAVQELESDKGFRRFEIYTRRRVPPHVRSDRGYPYILAEAKDGSDILLLTFTWTKLGVIAYAWFPAALVALSLALILAALLFRFWSLALLIPAVIGVLLYLVAVLNLHTQSRRLIRLLENL